MGYFSNGSEGALYEHAHCSACIHYAEAPDVCPVWWVHLAYVTDANRCEDKTAQMILDELIPIEGVWNQECKMRIVKEAQP